MPVYFIIPVFDIFHHYLSVYCNVAKANELGLKGGLPDINYQFIQSFSHSRVNFKNQWASHPELAERKAHLEKVAIDCQADDRSAWVIFKDKEKLQAEMTQVIYTNSNVEPGLEKPDTAYFEEWYRNEIALYELPLAYSGYYSNRYIEIADWDINSLVTNNSSDNFHTLFAEQNGRLNTAIVQNETDLSTIQAIKDKQIEVRSFDFDGVKYSVHDCSKIIAALETEIADQKEKLREMDKQAFIFFCNLPDAKETLLKDAKDYQQLDITIKKYNETANNILKFINLFYTDNCNFDFINATINKLKEGEEKKLKIHFDELIQCGFINKNSKYDLLKNLEIFNAKDYAYFSMEQFHNNELEDLTANIIRVAEELNFTRRVKNKKLLQTQLNFYNTALN